MKKFLAIFSPIVCFLVAGCIDSSITISVNKDGSGLITQTTFMSPALLQMMNSMNQQTGGASQPSPLQKQLDPAQYKAQALKMGEGVTFQSCKEVKKSDGSSGVEVVFAFTDINKVKITPSPQHPAGEIKTNEQHGKESNVLFQFTKGANPTITITMPPKKSADTLPPGGVSSDDSTNNEKPSPDQIQMMKQMFNGFRFRLQIKVNGEITKSNAAFIEKDSSGRGQIVTLIDMDLEKILNDEKLSDKLFSMGKIQDIETAREKLKDMPGLKFETAEKVEISFK